MAASVLGSCVEVKICVFLDQMIMLASIWKKKMFTVSTNQKFPGGWKHTCPFSVRKGLGNLVFIRLRYWGTLEIST